MIYIFDIDGTLADISHRLHFIQSKPADWRKFFAACPDDEPIPEVIQVAKSLGGVVHIMLLTGRSEEIREKTLDWLNELEIPCTALFMREVGDHREDSVVKSEMLDDLIHQWPNEKIMGIFEDRKQVVDMYRAKGLRVFQVAEGNF
jgi:hypothetical protein